MNYAESTIPQDERDQSLGDPRGIVWSSDGTRGYVTGMGSNNLVVIDSVGNRVGAGPVELGEGPTGLALDEARGLLYVPNRFEATISVLDAQSLEELGRVAMFDPTPDAIRAGRKHLYDTHETSGLGQISCGSCHVDSRMDRLGWDLGDPSGSIRSLEGRNLGSGMPGLTSGFEPYHPMKGVMMTQTLQDIIGHEPLHWRGDRDGLEEFNGAFMTLQGDDEILTEQEMQEFKDFLATIVFPPNPFRNLDNTLASDIDLPGLAATGRFAGQGGLAAGQALPNGNARAGLGLYRSGGMDGRFACVSCHTLPTGAGADMRLIDGIFTSIETGPLGEHHLPIVSVDLVPNRNMKTAQLRNIYEKIGLDLTSTSRAGFGFAHEGRVLTLPRFVGASVFNVESDQEIADLCAFMLSFSGSDLPEGSITDVNEPPGPPSNDTHAGVGTQVTVTETGGEPLIDAMIALAQAEPGRVDLVVKGTSGGLNRGWFYVRDGGLFQSDRNIEEIGASELRLLAAPGNPLTYTLVPRGSGRRIGIDRDGDGFDDRTELDEASDPADPFSIPMSGARRWDRYQ